MWEADEHKTAEQHKDKEGKLYHSTELCSYVLNTLLPHMFTSQVISMIWLISDAAEITTTVVTCTYIELFDQNYW